MRGLILAAGRGSRMGHLTDSRPKCLVKLAGKTLLEWQLAALRWIGIEDVGIVRGYLASRISDSRITSFDNREWRDTNMVFSFLRAREWLKGNHCIVSYGDIVFHPEVVDRLFSAPWDFAIAYDTAWKSLWEERFDDPIEDAESFQVCGGLVSDIGGRPRSLSEIEGQYMGLLKLTPNGWNAIDQFISRLTTSLIRKMDFTTLMSQMIEEGLQIGAVAVHGRWCEVDSQADLNLYERRILSDEPGRHDWRF